MILIYGVFPFKMKLPLETRFFFLLKWCFFPLEMRFFYNRFLQIKFGQIFSVHIDSLYWTLEGRKRNFFFVKKFLSWKSRRKMYWNKIVLTKMECVWNLSFERTLFIQAPLFHYSIRVKCLPSSFIILVNKDPREKKSEWKRVREMLWKWRCNNFGNEIDLILFCITEILSLRESLSLSLLTLTQSLTHTLSLFSTIWRWFEML